MTWALFVRTFRQSLAKIGRGVSDDQLGYLGDEYQKALQFWFNENDVLKLTLEEQVYIKECLKIKLDLSLLSRDFLYARKLFEKVLFEMMRNHIDIVVVFMKAFIKKLRAHKEGF